MHERHMVINGESTGESNGHATGDVSDPKRSSS